MKKECLFVLPSPFRDEFRIHGFRFGSGEKTLAVVGAMRGNEFQQQYVCALLVEALQDLEERGGLAEGREILVIPSANPFAMNAGKRFWTMDNTDINRVFPGYSLGETTQRVAAALFEQLQGYRFGVQASSYYLPVSCIPHVRLLRTGYEDAELAQGFGLPYTLVRTPRFFDTTTLNYNWQIWNTQAFSLYAGPTGSLCEELARECQEAVLRFLELHGVLRSHRHPGYRSEILQEDALLCVKARRAGILRLRCAVGENVCKGQLLAQILDPYDGSVHGEACAPEDGKVFSLHTGPLVLESAVLFRLIRL
ncbi:M14 family metallopeptidase [uncultured Mailhella sp.]|uniref:M14 family metallopeptidase n=1 Tax=uncultured Mailhella sp. TaxID=1981031 RepID=UPI002614F0C1|nr:M14 family metallopeptidase [uncultured Mailhella sp.]